MAEKFWNPKKKEGGSKISNTEWGMVIGALFLIDILEIGLDFAFDIGAVINPFIDFMVNLVWPTYLYLRGVNLKSTKMLLNLVLNACLTEVPDLDGFWGVEGLVTMAMVKAEEKIKEETGIDVEKAAALAKGKAEGEAEPETLGSGDAGGETPGTAPGEEGPEPSDEYADAMGRESDERDAAAQGEPPESTAGDGDLGDEDHDRSDEEVDKLGEQNETPEDRARREEEKKKKKEKEETGGKKKPGERGGESGLGGGQGGRGGSAAGGGPKPPSPRGGPDEKRESEKESTRLHSNLLDLSLSYGARKKQREEEDE